MGQAPSSPVLIADDFVAIRRYLCARLREAGFQTVFEAANGLEAVTKAAELQPALVLLDIGMPNLDGLQAAKQIRALAPGSEILFLSEFTDPDFVQAALNDGALGYVRKSEMNRELLPAIEAALKGAELTVGGSTF